jgi:2,4-dienoyl-CoA reductase-like NADH-dependent reductase (Old Yellow Enzyme family)
MIAAGEADLIALARTALDDPNWPLHAHHALDGTTYELWPIQARERIVARDKALSRFQA